jgi:putative ABC transport system permease protein
MSLLLGALAVGLLLALLSLGVFVSFRILRVLDLTTDGAFTLGGAVSGTLLLAGVPPIVTVVAGGIAGALAGLVTGLIHTKGKVDAILSGILVTTGLYSVTLWVMGSGNLSLASRPTLFDQIAALLPTLPRDLGAIGVLLLLVGFMAGVLALFVNTDLGLALRATGSNPRMAKAQAIDTALATTLGLALANSGVGISGALMAQYQGFANVQHGVGMIVTALASIILGEALFAQRTIRQRLRAALLGAVAFRLMVALVLRLGVDPSALKLFTALFVLLALLVPRWFPRLRRAHG